MIVLGLLGLTGGIVLDVMALQKTLKNRKEKNISKPTWLSLLWPMLAVFAGGMLTQAGVSLLNSYQNVLPAYQMVFSILGAGLLLSAIFVLVNAFILRYYKRLNADSLRFIKIILFSSIPVVLLTFFLWEESTANAWSYPLVSGFAITGEGFKWLYPGMNPNGFKVAWYGIFILLGFLTSYFISDHRFYKEFGKHGILETCLVVVFIFGIRGARIWYVVGNWNGDLSSRASFAERVGKGEWYCIFAVWEGGLTVLGGVVAGIVSGFIYMKLFRKYVPVTFALDVVVPAILIAQAIGRLGNFFNHEVYGTAVNISDGWWWLPTVVKNEMALGSTLAEGQINVPLFMVEGLFNIAGYFLIAWGIPALWKKYRAPGVLAGFYMIWYGALRMIMEPLRDADFNMGTDGSWSFWNAMIYIIIGVVLIGVLQAYEYFLRPRLEAKKAVAEGPEEEKAEEPKEATPVEEKTQEEAPSEEKQNEEGKAE